MSALTDLSHSIERTLRVDRPSKAPTIIRSPKPREKGYPITPFPYGWYHLVYSNELDAQEICSVTVLGQDLVVFRGPQGEVKVFSAHCPHLGAHLGQGGRVVDGEIECPFHRCRFGGEGECTKIPYAKKVPPKAKVRHWPSVEANGMVYMYYGPEGAEPAFEVPHFEEVGGARWRSPRRHTYHIETNILELAENGFDKAHFINIHGYDTLPAVHTEWRGPIVHMEQKAMGEFLGRHVETDVHNTLYGPGIQLIRVTSPIHFVALVTKTPLDENFVREHINVYMEKTVPFVDSIIHRVIAQRIANEAEFEFSIFAHKVYLKEPSLAEGDDLVIKGRKWFAQFYD